MDRLSVIECVRERVCVCVRERQSVRERERVEPLMDRLSVIATSLLT